MKNDYITTDTIWVVHFGTVAFAFMQDTIFFLLCFDGLFSSGTPNIIVSFQFCHFSNRSFSLGSAGALEAKMTNGFFLPRIRMCCSENHAYRMQSRLYSH